MKTLRTFATANALVLVLSGAAYAGTFVNDAGIEESIVPTGIATQVVGSTETILSDNPADGQYDVDLGKYVTLRHVPSAAAAAQSDEQLAEIGDFSAVEAPGYSLDDAGHYVKY